MNKNVTITVLVVIILVIGGYAIWKTVATPAPVIQVVDNSQDPTINQTPVVTSPSQPVNPSPANQQTQTPSNYINTNYHFQMNLPSGISLGQPNQTSGGVYLQANTTYGAPGLHHIDIVSSACTSVQGTTNVIINGISYLRTLGTGAFGGMESNSIDATYCAMHNGQSYNFTFTDEYNRVDPNATHPDQTTTYQIFDQQMQNLNFVFTN